MKKLVISLFSIAFFFHVSAGNDRITNQEYVKRWSHVAMGNMLSHNIPASITMAQAILESGSGNSYLARKGNNHFGIKCHGWNGDKIYHDDDRNDECFRKYENAELSFEDHSDFLTDNRRYAALFDLKIDDYKSWAKGLKKAGYATNPKYPKLLTDLVERLKLDELDKLVMNTPNSIENSVAVLNQTEKVEKTEGNTIQTSEKINRSFKYHDNKVKFIYANESDTYYKIAQEFGMTLRQVEKYNDVEFNQNEINAGDIVNLHPKKSRGKVDFKSYQKDLTLLQIAQIEGLKVEKLMEYNQITNPNEIILKNTQVALR